MAWLVCSAPEGRAAEIELKLAALERLIAAQMFTQDGRHYVRGNKNSHCQYAYLEAPRIDGDGGRLRIRARFSGRSALDLFNRCVGLGDSFDVAITAAPTARDNAIGLRDVNIATARDSYYISRVRLAMAQTIAKDFKLPVRDQAKQLLEQQEPGAVYKRELADFSLNEIRVTPDAIVLVVEFKLVVK
jgi:hypothetical protein